MKTNENNKNNKNNQNNQSDQKNQNNKNNSGNQQGSEQSKTNAGSNSARQKKHKPGENKSRINWMIAAAIPVLLVGGAVVYFILSGSPRFEQFINFGQVLNEKKELRSQLNERDSLINEYISTFNEVDEDLRKIRGKEQVLEFRFDSVEFARNRKKELLTQIDKINQMLDKNREKIRLLNRKLHNSGVKISALQDKIDNLQETISDRDSSINALEKLIVEKNNKIADLNEQVDDMEYDITKKNRVINENNRIIEKQNEMLEKAYLAYGTYKELNKKGVLKKEGGFLWFGRDIKLQEDVSNEKFREINIMEKKTVPLNSKKAELITNHPEGSYEFVKDSAQRIAYLKIENPREFWKITNYAVLETKK